MTQLVEHFDRNRDSYLAGGINEMQLRREFIDFFFSRFGRDVENKPSQAPPNGKSSSRARSESAGFRIP